MARITEAALDEVELRKLRPTVSFAPRLPAIVAPSANLAALVLLVGGAGILVAPDPLPLAGRLLAIAAVAAGGWLSRGRGHDPTADDLGRRDMALARREAQLNRVLTGFALRGSDVLVELARAGRLGPAPDEPRAPDGDDPGERRPDLRSVAGAGGHDGSGESLNLDADDGALG